MAETKPQETHDTCETRETSEDKLHETCDTEVAPVAPVASPAAPVDVPVDVPVMPVMPKLTSRKIGGLVTWVVDRHALAKASKISTEDPSPISPQRPRDREDRDGSPKTPSFKPSLPRRAFKEANRSNRSNGPECDAKCDEVPEKVAVAHTGEKIEKESERDETENEDSDSDACCSETETPSASNSPCSASEDPSEGQAFQGHGYPYGIPFWPVYFPVAGCQPNWWNMNEIAAQHLDACHKIALQRAERRGAPTKETCCVGCCCSRCIGIPAAYQPKKSEERLLKEKDEKAKPKTLEDENQGKDCDTISVQESLQETASSTSVSSGSSDSDMDVDEILNQLPPTRTLKWTTPDPRLQQHLRRPKLLRTVVCTNLHTDAIATDVHQAFQQRFIALPDYVDGYWKEGITSSAVLSVTIREKTPAAAFIVLFDEKLTSTALLFDGLEICGQRLHLRRPHECGPPVDGYVEVCDVSILYRLGMLSRPEKIETDPTGPTGPTGPTLGPAGATSKAAAKPRWRAPRAPSALEGLKHLYIGNLPERHSSLQDVTELVTCMTSELASYKEEIGPPMVFARPVRNGWVVEMQSCDLARDAQNCLRQMVLDGVQIVCYLTFGRAET